MTSLGQALFHEVSLRQGSYFRVNDVGRDVCLPWLDSLPRVDLRNRQKLMPENALLVVLSQDCDIACRTDAVDPCIELCVFKPIKDRDVFHGNQFVHSVRKLQLLVEGQWFEAKVEAIVTVNKAELAKLLTDVSLSVLSEFDRQCVVRWRANRYSRTALPDNFNDQLSEILGPALPEIDRVARVEGDDGKSYIRAIYVWINSLDELESYDFEFFALLRDDVSNETFTKIQDLIENIAEDLSVASGFNDVSGNYADRDSHTFVSYLTRFVRLNLDSESLRSGDSDTGVDLHPS
ncbi:hypothetical protein FH712_18060 [Marinobacter nauticus]|uniref:hypothetical protein n=1 Tax=Marinobacter nauticus TaxID=2743 RepID=UPI00112F804D|nr:hypothetical protein [Marinobacter nauticus]TPW22176.1 hypothetical protein FH712_18060 [Marinobacter nauticus]